jgi:hypothetical protein
MWRACSCGWPSSRRKREGGRGWDFPIIAIQEAGLDGFWIHRVLQSEGIESHVVDAASILTSRRRRRAKTDGIDGETLVRTLLAYKRGAPPSNTDASMVSLDRITTVCVRASGGRPIGPLSDRRPRAEIAFAFGEDRVFQRKGADIAVIADCNSHRIALRLPFEALMPRDVLPFPCEPRLASGEGQPAANEHAHRDRNRRD